MSLDQRQKSQQMTPSSDSCLGPAPGLCKPWGGWTTWGSPGPGSGSRAAGGVRGAGCGPGWLTLCFPQRRASTTRASSATRRSTPRPSCSATSSSTASRAWAGPSSVPCASQVWGPARSAGGPREGPGPALQSRGLSGCTWPATDPGSWGALRVPSLLPLLPPSRPRCVPAPRALATPRRQRVAPLLDLPSPPLSCCECFAGPASLFVWTVWAPVLLRELQAPSGTRALSLHTPPGPAQPMFIRDPGWVKGSSAGQASSPQTGCWLRQVAIPAQVQSQGLCWPPSCGPDGSRCAWGEPGLPLPLPTSAVCRSRKPTLGRVLGGRGSLECSPPRHTAASGRLVCAQRLGSCHQEAGAVTCSLIGLRKGLCSGEHPAHSLSSGSSPSLSGAPPSVTITGIRVTEAGGWLRGPQLLCLLVQDTGPCVGF